MDLRGICGEISQTFLCSARRIILITSIIIIMYEPKIYFLLFYREAISTDAIIEKRLIRVESEEEGAVVGASSDVDVVAGSSDVDVVIGGSAVSQPTLKAPGHLPSS